jgi:hypothetical protein
MRCRFGVNGFLKSRLLAVPGNYTKMYHQTSPYSYFIVHYQRLILARFPESYSRKDLDAGMYLLFMLGRL